MKASKILAGVTSTFSGLYLASAAYAQDASSYLDQINGGVGDTDLMTLIYRYCCFDLRSSINYQWLQIYHSCRRRRKSRECYKDINIRNHWFSSLLHSSYLSQVCIAECSQSLIALLCIKILISAIWLSI